MAADTETGTERWPMSDLDTETGEARLGQFDTRNAILEVTMVPYKPI